MGAILGTVAYLNLVINQSICRYQLIIYSHLAQCLSGLKRIVSLKAKKKLALLANKNHTVGTIN
jgi:hypothetical protein